MAHKAGLTHATYTPPRRAPSAEALLWRRRFAIALVVVLLLAMVIAAAPLLLSTAVAAGIFDGWDVPVEYD